MRIRYRQILNRFSYIENSNNSINIDKKTVAFIKWDIRGSNNVVEIGKYCNLNNLTVFIRGSNHKITIGNNVSIQGGELWIEDENCNIKIGNNTTIIRAHIAVTENGKSIIIGEDCMLSRDIEIRTGDSHAIIDLNTAHKINPAQNVIIKSHVWIGRNVTILKGVTIENGCIVGTGSIVTKDMPNNSIIAGTPASIIKQNVTWKRDRY